MDSSSQSTSLDNEVTPKPVVDPNEWRFAHDFFFDIARATHKRPVRRFCVSAGIGIGAYAIGLVIAELGGFADVYMATPGVYITLSVSAFIFGRLRWGAKEVGFRLNSIREAFIVTDLEYRQVSDSVWKRASARSLFYLQYFSAIGLLTAVMLASYFMPSTRFASHLKVLRPSTFPNTWFTGRGLIAKFVDLDWLMAVALFTLISGLYLTTVGGQLFWRRLILPWNVVPVPSYVMIRVTPVANIFFHGTLYYAVGLLGLVVLYGGTFSIPVVIVVGLFALLGVACILVPLFSLNKLVLKARDQVASSIASQYYRGVFPLASGHYTELSGSAIQTDDSYVELKRLEELMSTVNSASSGLFRVSLLIPAIVSQAIPFLGFLYPVLTHR